MLVIAAGAEGHEQVFLFMHGAESLNAVGAGVVTGIGLVIADGAAEFAGMEGVIVHEDFPSVM